MASSDVISEKPESKDTIQAASSEVAFEEFKLQNTTAAIYVLDKTLKNLAKDIKEFLTKDCEITACDDHWSEHVGNTIEQTAANCQHFKSLHPYKPLTSTAVSIRSYGYLERLITETKRRVEGRGLHHDVIILLGHSSELLAEDKDLVETFAKLNPTIIAFVGCCGGNTRYGPILTMSYMLYNINISREIPSPMIAFYQRQVYMDELFNTSLIIGLQYYLHIRYGDKVGIRVRGYTEKDMAKYAFALAKLNKSVPPTDPTSFINDREGNNPVQMILHKCDLTTEAAPLSCMQLATYSPMVVDSKHFKSFAIDLPDTPKRIIPTITLPKESCLEHKLVIEDVLCQLDPQKIKITIHGDTQNITVEQHVYHHEVIISKTLPTKITISEDNKNLKSNKLQGIEVMSPDDSEIEPKQTDSSDTDMKIKLAAGRGLIIVDSIRSDHKTIKLYSQLYHHYMCKTLIGQDEQEIRLISQGLPLQGITVDELSGVCQKKIKEHQLHKIIPLVCEIKFIKLFNYTLELLRKGNKRSWDEIDPLQFLVAVLRGHWGKIETDVIKKWATYYLKKSMNNVKKDNPESLHQYKLCCMCFILLFEDSFVRFVKDEDEKDYHQYDIIVCIKEKNELNDVINTDNSPQRLPDESHTPFPPDKDLLSCWVDLLQHCKPISDCVDLYNKDDHPKWAIGNRYGPKLEQQENTYNYKYAEFLLVMGALSDECQKKEDTLRRICYHVSEFENKNNEEKGHMKCFIDDPKDIEEMDKTIVEELFIVKSEIEGLSFVETRLLLDCSEHNRKLDKKLQGDKVNLIKKLLDLYKKDPAMWHLPDVPTLEEVIKTVEAAEDTLDETFNTFLNQVIGRCLHQAYATLSIEKSLCQAVKSCTATNWDKVSSCRFVFAQFMTDNKHEIKGILFYTETHYGDNLIVFNEEQLHELKEKCTCYDPRKKTNCYEKVTELITPRRVSRENFLKAITILKGPCRYRMLQITVEQMEHEKILIFPFVKVGRLTLTYENG